MQGPPERIFTLYTGDGNASGNVARRGNAEPQAASGFPAAPEEPDMAE
jgi:hypothetical protein